MKHDPQSLLLKNLDRRTDKFRRNIELEALLAELEGVLGPMDRRLQEQFEYPEFAPLFLVGNPRSGTTMTMQMLDSLDSFAVPSNFLSRFYYAPYLGAKILQLLTDMRFDFKNEMGNSFKKSEKRSALGKTGGPLQPSEFFHFWRQFLPNYDPEYLPPDRAGQVDQTGLRRGIAALSHVLQQPFAGKAIILQYNLELLLKIFPDAKLIYLTRQPLFIMQSIYRARLEFYGDENVWWSVKPREYEMLAEMDVARQVAGQVYYTDQYLGKAMLDIPEPNRLVIQYEDLCQSPAGLYDQLKEWYPDSERFKSAVTCPWDPQTVSNQLRLDEQILEDLENAYLEFVKKDHA